MTPPAISHSASRKLRDVLRKFLLLSLVAGIALSGCATMKPSIARGSAGLINVIVVAQYPLKQSDADRFVTVLQDYLPRYVHDGKALTLTLKLDHFDLGASAFDDVSTNGYQRGDYLVATYLIADASGKPMESRRFALYPMSFLWEPNMQLAERTQALHDAASFLAQRVAQVQ